MQNWQVLIKKIVLNKTRHLLIEKELNELKSFDLGYFIRKTHFDEDGSQNHWVFQPILEYFTLDSNWITKWKSRGLSNESLEIVSTSNNAPSTNYYGDKVRLRFTENVL